MQEGRLVWVKQPGMKGAARVVYENQDGTLLRVRYLEPGRPLEFVAAEWVEDMNEPGAAAAEDALYGL